MQRLTTRCWLTQARQAHDYQQKMMVAYKGRPGSFSAMQSFQYFGYYQAAQAFNMNATYNRNVIGARQFSSNNQKDQDEQEAKDVARQFMSAVNEEEQQIVDEVNSIAEWQPKVMEQSVPIILDCYAEWCNPCKKLTPQLEKLAQENEGKFRLVKLNIDNLPQISKGLNVKSIPALFLIYRGNIMDSMAGMDMDRIKDMIQTAHQIEAAVHDETVMDKVMDEAQKYIEGEQYKEGEVILRDGFTYEHWRDKFAARILTGIAYCQLMESQDTAAARETLAPLTEAQVADTIVEGSYWHDLIYKVDEEIQRLDAVAERDQAEKDLEAQLEAEPSSCELRFELATMLVEKNRAEESIGLLLDIIAINRNWEEKKANTLLMEVFNKVGAKSEAVKQGRKKLAKILF